jgi:hypothetical protein
MSHTPDEPAGTFQRRSEGFSPRVRIAVPMDLPFSNTVTFADESLGPLACGNQALISN